jgi:hypothetical protein
MFCSGFALRLLTWREQYLAMKELANQEKLQLAEEPNEQA